MRHNAPAAFSAFRTQINNPVRLLDDVEMVLDDQHGVSQIHKPLQHVEQFSHVVKMQSRRRLIENVERPARLPLGKLARQLDALRFPAGKRRGGLPQRHVPEPHVHQRRKLLLNLRNVFEQFQRIG